MHNMWLSNFTYLTPILLVILYQKASSEIHDMPNAPWKS